MRYVAAIAVGAVTAVGCGCPAPTPAVVQPAFNARVLALIDDYPVRGSGGYAWPSPPGSDGTTRDLASSNVTIARGGAGNHCVGVTLEVFRRALATCPGGVEEALPPDVARDFKDRWYLGLHDDSIDYWSSQPWTGGIDRSTSPIGDDGFDRERVYVARAACPRT